MQSEPSFYGPATQCSEPGQAAVRLARELQQAKDTIARLAMDNARFRLQMEFMAEALRRERGEEATLGED
jgi:hypothetical protein